MLAQLSRAPAEHIRRHRTRLHQLLRELRASARRTASDGRSLAEVHLLVLRRGAERARGADRERRRTELDRLALALAAHDPQRTLARGYALVEDRSGEPLTSAAAAREAQRLKIRFHDDSISARVDE
jgi:exodeoxyribonuclease VII large subunit